jgi:hypothetical protein
MIAGVVHGRIQQQSCKADGEAIGYFVESADPRLLTCQPILQQSLAYDFAVSALGFREPASAASPKSYQIQNLAGLL